ncbi:DUF4307 domain-containing protein [Demequina pelophila]|uniref:DUF4307 domain-containing protein n=1 Tax=Demequina pelophila TaxID=1638984 RepID=UPI0007824352|nr:DUF4307 domain-containing protein [Demequina pelophila]
MGTPNPGHDELASPALPRLSRRSWTLVGLGLAALTAVVAWFAFTLADEPVRWRDVGFAIVSPTEATATFDVFLYSEAGATCTVRALDVRYGEVGVATVEVDRADGAEQRVTATIRTTEEATSVTVQGCVAR